MRGDCGAPSRKAQTCVKDSSNGFWEIDAADRGSEFYIVPGWRAWRIWPLCGLQPLEHVAMGSETACRPCFVIRVREGSTREEILSSDLYFPSDDQDRFSVGRGPKT